jgi:hypothetical protein
MHLSRLLSQRLSFLVAAMLVLICVVSWIRTVQAQSYAQIGTGSPLPVFVTNAERLPEGFVAGSRWRFTTWTVPSVITWTAVVNSTSGAWANLTTTNDDQTTSTRWYFVPAMPGSWERQ